MKFLVTLTERTPTEDGRDISSYHIILDDMDSVTEFLEEYIISYGCPLSFLIVPAPADLQL